MAYGSALVDTIQSSTTGTPTVFKDGSGTETGMLSRAWVNFNGISGASPVIRASFNISSVTRTAAGYYTVVMTNAMPDANYATVFGTAFDGTYGGFLIYQNKVGVTKTASTFYITTFNTGGTTLDSNEVDVSVFR